MGYKRLIDEFNMTQEADAKKVRKSRVSVAQTLRLLSLPQRVQESMVEGNITEGHGKVLLSLPDEKAMLKLWKKIIKQDLTIRGAEEAKSKVAGPKRLRPVAPEQVNQEEDLQNYLNTRVRINNRGRRGSIVIEYFSKEEKNAIIKKILK
jgi:ParB family chromosome partitioning protein